MFCSCLILLALLPVVLAIALRPIEPIEPIEPRDPDDRRRPIILPPPLPRPPTCVGFPCPRGQHCILLPLEIFFCLRPPCRYPLHPVCVPNIIRWPPIRFGDRD